MCSDMTDAILESYPHPKKSLFEDAGVETDEEAGVKIPQNWSENFLMKASIRYAWKSYYKYFW